MHVSLTHSTFDSTSKRSSLDNDELATASKICLYYQRVIRHLKGCQAFWSLIQKALTNTLRHRLSSRTRTHKSGRVHIPVTAAFKCPWLTQYSFVPAVNQSAFITLCISYCQLLLRDNALYVIM